MSKGGGRVTVLPTFFWRTEETRERVNWGHFRHRITLLSAWDRESVRRLVQLGERSAVGQHRVRGEAV